MPEISYDPEVKILSIRMKNNKIADSNIQGNCIIDYDNEGNIVNIDISDINIEEIIKTNSKKTIIKIKK